MALFLIKDFVYSCRTGQGPSEEVTKAFLLWLVASTPLKLLFVRTGIFLTRQLLLQMICGFLLTHRFAMSAVLKVAQNRAHETEFQTRI